MRCNIGVNPKYLVDQHLLAEMMEIPMVVGSLRYWKFQIKSSIPETFCLGSGHMNFLKNKLRYLQRRHHEVEIELKRRNFHNTKSKVDLTGVPEEFCNDWNPSFEDSLILRSRIHWKLRNKEHLFWRYLHKPLGKSDLEQMIFNVDNGDLFYV